jgi:hypothetical protein
MNINKLIVRAKDILLTPRAEWPVIAAEPETIGGLYLGYIAILAAIPAIRLFLSFGLIGTSIGFGVDYRMGFVSGLSMAITTYVLSLIGTFIVALIVDALAPTFGGRKDRVQALKVVAYSYTASWVASIIGIVPGLGVLAALAGLIYGLYLLYMGLPYTMHCPPEKSAGYTAVTVIAAIVCYVVLGVVVRSVGGYGGYGDALGSRSLAQRAALAALAAQSSAGQGTADQSSAAKAVDSYTARMDAASKQLDEAQKSGDPAAKANALGQFMGAALGSGGKVESLPPDQIKTFLPDQLDGLNRTQQAVERNSAVGIQSSKATATYSDGTSRTLNLEITDAGSLKGLVGFAGGWAGVEQESQTDAGFDKTYRSNGQLVHESWNNQSQSGEYTTFVVDRFAVKVSGHATDISELKRAVGSVNTSGLAALKDSGVSAN